MTRGRYRSYSVDFKKEIALTYLSGEATLLGLARQHEVSRNLIRLWVKKFEGGEFDDEQVAAELLSQYEQRIAELERKVGQLTMENDLLKKTTPRPRRANAVSCSIVSGPKASPSDEGAS